MTDYRKLRPLGARVLVQRYPLSRMSEGGIYVIGLDYPTLGKVLAVGPGFKLHKFKQCSAMQVPTGLHEKTCSDCGAVTKSYGTHFAAYRRLDLRVGDDVQWAVDSNFDLKQLSKDIFLFDYKDLNLVGSET